MAARTPVAGARGGSLYVSELQRTRLLEATFAVVAEEGYQGMAVRSVTERARVSGKTFYDLFSDREDCFLAAFDRGVGELAVVARGAYEGERDWASRVRAGLGALLGCLEREPALRRLVFVEALAAGPRVLVRRAEVIEELAGVVDGGREGVKGGGELPPLTAEAVVGAAFGVVHARLLQRGSGSLTGLLNALMATIVAPYRGRAAATKELRRTGAFSAGRESSAGVKSPAGLAEGRAASPVGVRRPLGSIAPVDFRMTVRTQTVLAAVAELAGRGDYPSNQRVSALAGISDQGQISRLMMRLAEQGLLENTRGAVQGPKAWRLTVRGERIIRANPPLAKPAGKSPAAGVERRASGPRARSSLRPAGGWPAGSEFRLTARTLMVLTAVADLGGRGLDPSNREIAKAAGIRDQGQISRLLQRLERHQLLLNSGGATAGAPNAWRLTPQGQEIVALSGRTAIPARESR